MKHRTERESSKPAALPINLRDARLKLSEAIQLFGYALLALLVGAIGGWLALAALPSGAADWSKLRLVVFVFGGGVVVVSVWLSVSVCRLMVESWHAYLEWCWMYAEVDVAGRQASGNTERETETVVWELGTTTPRDVLLVALAVYWQQKEGKQNAHTVRALQGDKWIAGVRLGDVNTTQAGKLSKALRQIGLVTEAGERSAGTWQAGSADDVLELVAANWQKVREEQ